MCFAALKVWDTEHNNGVLIYLLWRTRASRSLADRESGRVGAKAGNDLPRMEGAFREGNFERAVCAGSGMFRVCWNPFSSQSSRPNELRPACRS